MIKKIIPNEPIYGFEILENFSPLQRQIFVACIPILATISAGFTTGFSSILIPQLQSNESSIQVTEEMCSWVASLAVFAMAPGCLLAGYAMQEYGRKLIYYFLCIVAIIGWISIYLAESLTLILLGRFLTGLSVGLLGPIGAVYIGETTEPQYRGILLATITLAISFGILLCHIMGTYFHWQSIALFSATIFPFITLVILTSAPESPSWLMTKNRVEDAEKAFRWLRGQKLNSLTEDAQNELDDLVKKHEKQRKEEDAHNISNNPGAILKTHIKKPEFYKPLLIVLISFFVMQFSGVNLVAFYTVNLMKNVTDGGNEYLSMIIIDTVRVISSFCACILLKVCYRRTLLIISGIGSSVCMVLVSTCMYLSKMNALQIDFSWMSMVFLIGYICFVSCGLFPLPWVLQAELLQQTTRGFSSGLTTCFNFICFFTVVKTFGQMSLALETFGIFIVYASIALIGTIILYTILPETKNRTLQQIEEGFSKK